MIENMEGVNFLVEIREALSEFKFFNFAMITVAGLVNAFGITMFCSL